MTSSREIQLVRRPRGAAVLDDFALVERDLHAPGPGEVLVRNSFVSVDPYMRGRMNEAKSYVPPFGLHEAMTGGAVGRVVAGELAEGTLVSTQYGWREAFVARVQECQVLPEPPAGLSESVYLGALGMPGMTAWVGLTQVAPVAEGDVVFISAASGAVGSVAGQLARARGASLVLGSAGSAAKCAAVQRDLGYDACFDHHDGQPGEHLAELAPKGIDVYFDNVGGRQFDAALVAARSRARFALCGSISSGYDGGAGDPVRNMGLAVGKRLQLRGFIVSDFGALQPAFVDGVGGLVANGKLTVKETTRRGLDSAVGAFLGLFTGGDQIGKVVVAV